MGRVRYAAAGRVWAGFVKTRLSMVSYGKLRHGELRSAVDGLGMMR